MATPYLMGHVLHLELETANPRVDIIYSQWSSDVYRFLS